MDPCLLYLGTSDGVFVLRCGGPEAAEVIGRGIGGNVVRGIAVHPRDPRTAYIACGLRGWGLYRTRDAGRSFESLGFDDHWVWDAALHPTDPRTIYVGTEPPGLYVSHDEGQSFQPREGIHRLPGRPQWHFFHLPFRDQPMQSGHIHGFALHPQRPNRIIAGVEQGGVILSEDGGETWQERLAGYDVHRMAVDPADPDRIFAGAGEGLFLSDDGGRAWRSIGRGLPGAGPADSLDLHPSHPDILFYGGEPAAGTGRLFMSTDRGETWQAIDVELPKVWRLRAALLG